MDVHNHWSLYTKPTRTGLHSAPIDSLLCRQWTLTFTGDLYIFVERNESCIQSKVGIASERLLRAKQQYILPCRVYTPDKAYTSLGRSQEELAQWRVAAARDATRGWAARVQVDLYVF